MRTGLPGNAFLDSGTLKSCHLIRIAMSFAWLANTTALVAQVSSPQVDFNRDIRPILADNCFRCHGPDANQRKAKLRFDSQADSRVDLGGYQAIKPGHAEDSELIRRILSSDPDEVMPPPEMKRKLTSKQKDLLKRWIDSGAQYDRRWAWKPPARPALPTFRERADWPKNAVDYFILQRLQGDGLGPSLEADLRTLIRRLTLDLTGLPPTPGEVEAFLADTSPDAYETVVDRLLNSPHYGERMAIDWLDAARYADSNGYQVDRDREMYAWRDWVIRAFNENKPFDEFTIEQVAGDLLPNPTLAQRVATGFHRNHMMNEEGGVIPAEFLAEYCADRVETTATVWLGQTFICSRCHDHKFDPFTQRDYYSMYAFFHNVTEQGKGNYGASIRRNNPPMIQLSNPELEAKRDELRKQLASLQDELKTAAKKTPEHEKLTKRVAAMKKLADEADLAIPTALVMEEMAKPRPTFILIRGAYDKPGEPVSAGTPASLPAMRDGLPHNRLGLARWLVDPANPLPSRVTVNRLWQSIFGNGIVRTPEDLGAQGDFPSHPELLDWLAVEFIESGWNVKAMIRLMVTSATYRQSSRLNPALTERDPENRLLARGSRYRLQAEFLRDQALAASGLLVRTLGGPSVRPYHPPGLYEQVVAGKGTKTYVQDKGPGLYRRTMYSYWKRSVPNPAMLAFDAPFRETCIVRRSRTNTPMQALNLMNDPTYVEAAEFLAQQMIREGGATVDSRLTRGFQMAIVRPPRNAELAVLRSGFQRALADFKSDPAAAKALLQAGNASMPNVQDEIELAAYAMAASAILNLDETVTRE
mgnify:CR=1 FL=1